MAIGIGANAAMFSLWTPCRRSRCPSRAGRIVRGPGADSTSRNGISTLNFVDWKRHEFAGGVRAGLARGNVALADHGQTFVSAAAGDDLIPQDASERAYRPVLKKTGLAQVVAFDEAVAGAISATALSRVDPRMALPALVLRVNGETWRPQRDLLNSDRFALEFVVETEIDGRGEARARVRFGDGVLGRQPAAGTRFVCEFRLGGGSKGNVGADAVTQLAPAISGVKVRNPMPARGGADHEPMSQAGRSTAASGRCGRPTTCG